MKDYHFNIKPNQQKSIMLAKRQLVEFVCDAVNLEGINYTLPEVQTLLDGVTVGGHKVADQQITLNQAKAWHDLFYRLEHGQFVVSPRVACELHGIAGEEEALEWGKFRTGGVTIAGTNYLPPDAQELPGIFRIMTDEAGKLPDIYDQAIHIFLTMARTQFFYDVNKRLGRFMMNGVLLSNGYPAINVQAKRQLEFNRFMIDFYKSNNQQSMNDFLRSCLDPQIIKIMNEPLPEMKK